MTYNVMQFTLWTLMFWSATGALRRQFWEVHNNFYYLEESREIAFENKWSMSRKVYFSTLHGQDMSKVRTAHFIIHEAPLSSQFYYCGTCMNNEEPSATTVFLFVAPSYPVFIVVYIRSFKSTHSSSSSSSSFIYISISKRSILESVWNHNNCSVRVVVSI